MMIVQPIFIRARRHGPRRGRSLDGRDHRLDRCRGGRGKAGGGEAEKVAVTVKMIQNVLIGVMAFAVAVYWTTKVEVVPNGPRPTLWEIWYRFPKFVLGFIAASIIFSILYAVLPDGNALVQDLITKGVTSPIRVWLFCLAFIAIGLETNFRELLPYMKAGKPLTLYVVGQSLNSRPQFHHVLDRLRLALEGRPVTKKGEGPGTRKSRDPDLINLTPRASPLPRP